MHCFFLPVRKIILAKRSIVKVSSVTPCKINFCAPHVFIHFFNISCNDNYHVEKEVLKVFLKVASFWELSGMTNLSHSSFDVILMAI